MEITSGDLFRVELEEGVLLVTSYPEEVDYITWSITNRGKKKLFVKCLVGIEKRLWRPLWLFSRINRQRRAGIPEPEASRWVAAISCA